MRILSLETSTGHGSVCLLENQKVLSERKSDNPKAHSDFLHHAIEEVLQEADLKIQDIDLFATGIGPGSFTGIRIAANAVKSFSYLTDKPIVAIDSLTLLVNQVQEKNMHVLTLINAYKNMNYSAVYRFENSTWTQVLEPKAVGAKNIQSWLMESDKTSDLKSFIVVGDGYNTYLPFFEPEILAKTVRPQNPLDFPTAETLGKLAFLKANTGQTIGWKFVSPLYIRASEAEENKRGLIFSPLK